MKEALPKIVKFIKYHWRHCCVFDPSQNNKHLYEVAQQFGYEHAHPHDSSPEEKVKKWMKEHGYVFEAEEPNQRERWVLA